MISKTIKTRLDDSQMHEHSPVKNAPGSPMHEHLPAGNAPASPMHEHFLAGNALGRRALLGALSLAALLP
ncbi:MAG: hypothetical protein ACREH6_05830, partial [Geminicoccaceae bacterium]